MTELAPDAIHKARQRGIWFSILSIVIILCIILALRNLNIGKEEIDSILIRVSWPPLLLSCLAMSLAFFFMGVRWSALLPCKDKPPKIELTALICAGLLLNYAAPGPVGEFGAAWFAHKRYKLPFTDTLAAGVAARLIGLISACFIGTLVWLIFPLPTTEEYQTLIELMVFTTAAGGLILMALALRPRQFNSLLERFDTSTTGIKATILNMLRDITRSIEQLSAMGLPAFAKSAFWSLCAHSSVVTGIILAAIALNTSYSLEGLIFTYTITTAAAVLLFALPGSYLGWDALFFGLMVNTAAIPLSDAMAITIIIRLQQFFFMLLGGISLGWLLQTTEKPPA